MTAEAHSRAPTSPYAGRRRLTDDEVELFRRLFMRPYRRRQRERGTSETQ